MEATYLRETNNHYLVIPISSAASGDYQVPMLLENRIPGLLPVHRQIIDGVSALYYEVTSFRSLSDSFEAEKLSLDMIRKILLYLSRMAEEIDRYLLRGNGLVLDPEYIFVSMNREEICFCYNPCSTKSGSESLNSIARFILDHIDYDDRTCSALAYRLFQESMQESVSITDFAKMAVGYEVKETEESLEEVQEDDSEYMTEFSTKENGEKKSSLAGMKKSAADLQRNLIQIVILGTLNAVILAILFWGLKCLRNYWFPGNIQMIMITMMGLLLAAGIVVAAERRITALLERRLHE